MRLQYGIHSGTLTPYCSIKILIDRTVLIVSNFPLQFQVLTYKKLIEKFQSIGLLSDLDYRTNDNQNVSYVRLSLARAELYRQGNRECFSGRSQPFDDLPRIEDLPPGPLSLIKIEHNVLLHRYLNNEVRGSNFKTMMRVL